MKRVVLNYLVFAAIAISAVCTSCNKEVQLLETVTYRDGTYEYYDMYEYDNQNRITKWSRYEKDGKPIRLETISYSGNDFIKVEFETPEIEMNTIIEFTKSANKIIVKTNNIMNNHDDIGTATWYLNNDGLPIKYEIMQKDFMGEVSYYVATFQIQDGNVMSFLSKSTRKGTTNENSHEFKYDHKKSPLYNCKTQKWWLICKYYDGFQNNVTEYSLNNELKAEYMYEYDSFGFPIKSTKISDDKKIVINYKYIKRKSV